jgi:hypothetical protein
MDVYRRQFIIIHLSPYHQRHTVWLLRESRKINYQTTYRLGRNFSTIITEGDAHNKLSVKEYWRQFNAKWRLLYVLDIHADSQKHNPSV